MITDAHNIDDSSRRGPLRRAHQLPSDKIKRRTSCLPQETVDYLKAWMMSPAHVAHPYPTEQEKVDIMADTGIELKQLTNWFVNNRKRFWKPQVEGKLPKATLPTRAVLVVPKTKIPAATVSEPVSPTLRGMVTKHSDSFFSNMRTVSQVSLYDESQPRPAVVSPMRGAVSENSSCSGSDDESLASTADDNFRQQIDTQESSITKSDKVKVYILRPDLGDVPTLDDVTIDDDLAAAEQVVEQFECVLSYSFQVGVHDKERDAAHQAEVDRLKTQCLQKYLKSTTLSTRTTKRTRLFDDMEDAVETPRPKFRRISIDMWKEACLSVRDGYDSRLPSLEEAANLFGFAEPLSSAEI